jgi:asparagine synthase (glutamine-hydrolysing)
MSGIVGIVQFDGKAVEPRLLRDLTDFLSFRGPDAQRTWIKDAVGFGHALLKTTEESDRDWQPFTLDDNSWIVADARIDAREQLISDLKAAGESDLARSNGTDAELILRAYRCWDTACVEHLRGDFAFGIWNDGHQQLFCARDHMGTKPFYYAQIGSRLIFSNTLDCIRRHPLISDRLNELAIADFLLFGVNQDPATTSFAEIQRLPPAHCANWSRNGMQLRRYWSLPIDEPLFYKRSDDYIDHFRDLLAKSVDDRLRTNQVWIFMSGGLDSPTLAATARDLMQKRYIDFDLRALTIIQAFPSDEGRYAKAVATYLKIPHYCRSAEAVENWEEIPFSTPEPHPNAWNIPAERQFWQGLGTYSRVFFFGEGPDNALHFEWLPCISHLARHGFYRRLVAGLAATVFSQRYPPFWWRIRDRNSTRDSEAVFPPWIESSLDSRLRLRDRWDAFNSPLVSAHRLRPVGYASFQVPLWQAMFESLDAATTHACFEVRHPYVDLPLLRFMLAVPALPWCRSKYLMRRAMRGMLPREVLRRRKTGLDPASVLKQIAGLCSTPFLPGPVIREYVDLDRTTSVPAINLIESNLRVRALNHWLQNSLSANDNQAEDPFSDRVFRQDAAN